MRNASAFVFLGIITLIPAFGQQPFVCRGDYFLALSSALFKVEIDPATNEVVFAPVSGEPVDFSLNAIGFRSTDGYIYGIREENLDLYRIGADGRPVRLASLDGFNKNLSYPAGDITPDGRYLVLLGGIGDFTGESGESSDLVFIDLESPSYAVSVRPLGPNNVRCFDIAFDPESGSLFGFDSVGDRLVSFDVNTGRVNTSYPADGTADAMGSLFFDAFGHLYGYGWTANGQSQNTLFRIDKHSGEVAVEASGPGVQRSDGCSCPYTIQMQKTATPNRVISCSEQTFTFTFANASGQDRDGLTLIDTFPDGFEISGVDNPLGGTLHSGPGSNVLRLENLTVPLGESSLTVRVRSEPGVAGVFTNQAMLSGLPKSLGEGIVSDDPATLVRNDPTDFRVDLLAVDFGMLPREMCSGDTLLLDPAIDGAAYLWNDGSNGPALAVTEGGTYAVTVSSGCETLVETISITENEIDVDLPGQLEIQLGDSIRLQPELTGTPPFSFAWTGNAAYLSCSSCREPSARPLSDGFFALELVDANGCRARDSVFIRVDKERSLYIPNAFSPNGDGVNDRFAVFAGKGAVSCRSLRVFSRDGALVFGAFDLPFDEESRGWDGRYRGRPMPPGVFVYVVEVEFLDGEVEVFSGDLTLVR